jgi:hypothetical protein
VSIETTIFIVSITIIANDVDRSHLRHRKRLVQCADLVVGIGVSFFVVEGKKRRKELKRYEIHYHRIDAHRCYGSVLLKQKIVSQRKE